MPYASRSTTYDEGDPEYGYYADDDPIWAALAPSVEAGNVDWTQFTLALSRMDVSDIRELLTTTTAVISQAFSGIAEYLTEVMESAVDTEEYRAILRVDRDFYNNEWDKGLVQSDNVNYTSFAHITVAALLLGGILSKVGPLASAGGQVISKISGYKKGRATKAFREEVLEMLSETDLGSNMQSLVNHGLGETANSVLGKLMEGLITNDNSYLHEALTKLDKL